MKKSKGLKGIFALFLCFCMIFGMTSVSFASSRDDDDEDEKDYSISSATLENDGDTITGEWDEANDKTTYKIQLYKNGKKSGSAKTVSETTYDFTKLIIKAGVGTYSFYVYPTKGGNDYKIESSNVKITSSILDDLKDSNDYDEDDEDDNDSDTSSGASLGGPALSTTQTGNQNGGPGAPKTNGWVPLTDGKWQFFENGIMVTNNWKQVNNLWYHFDNNGTMQTGWLDDSGIWYFLSGSGAMLADTVTPDGYTVNASGAWVQ